MTVHEALLEQIAQSMVADGSEARNLTAAERRRWAYCLFILHFCAADLVDFLEETAMRISQQLQANTEPVQQTHRGRIRGRVLWPATVKARAVDNGDPTLFACRHSRRHFVTPENELFAFLISNIAQGIQHLPPWLVSGMAYFEQSNGTHVGTNIGQPLAEQFEKARSALNRLQRTAYLATIPTPERVTEFHLLRAETARMGELGDVAVHARRYLLAVDNLEPTELAQLSRRLFVLPHMEMAEGDVESVRSWMAFYILMRNHS